MNVIVEINNTLPNSSPISCACNKWRRTVDLGTSILLQWQWSVTYFYALSTRCKFVVDFGANDSTKLHKRNRSVCNGLSHSMLRKQKTSSSKRASVPFFYSVANSSLLSNYRQLNAHMHSHARGHGKTSQHYLHTRQQIW